MNISLPRHLAVLGRLLLTVTEMRVTSTGNLETTVGSQELNSQASVWEMRVPALDPGGQFVLERSWTRLLVLWSWWRLTPSQILECALCLPCPLKFPRDIALRQRCGVENTCAIYVTEPS